MRVRSGVTWFEDDDYIGTTVSFPSGSTWKIQKKLKENEHYVHESLAQIEGMGFVSEARAVFIVTKLSGEGPQEAVIKIRMQIPWQGTWSNKPAVRAKQATMEMAVPSQQEVKGLSILTTAGCSSTPAMFSWVKEQQESDQWVPGGYILYILMEKLPGIDPTHAFFNHMSRQERDDLRASFKAAWVDCVAHGVDHGDPGIRNLIWDNANKKCYLVDFEGYSKPTKRSVWSDNNYFFWNLAADDLDTPSDDVSE